MSVPSVHPVIRETQRWIESMVIGLNLCPFARKVFEQNTIHYVVSEARDAQTLLTELAHEMRTLAEMPSNERETTFLIHPRVLDEFFVYNDFLTIADHLLVDLDLEGVLQIASFHPEYQFAETPGDGVENYSNRSPYPMLHLLREESISAVAGDPEALLEIPPRNQRTLRELGLEKVLERLRAIREK